MQPTSSQQSELNRLQQAIAKIKQDAPSQLNKKINKLCLNPSLQILKLNWQNIPTLLRGDQAEQTTPQPGEEYVLLYMVGEELKVESADANDLLAIKIMAEDLRREDIAEEGEAAIGIIDQIINTAIQCGFLWQPPSKIQRSKDFPHGQDCNDFFTAKVFTLQWHITQTCDLHCKHCYDRSERSTLDLNQGLKILDGLRRFCLKNNIQGQVSFSGGNPLLYPHFFELYQGAVQRNLQVAILGNPTSREVMEKIIAIQPPAYYQVSLEGLEEHNDFIRGTGHFKRIIKFLTILKELNIYSMVMLTLTRNNQEQVIPLATELRGKADEFTYNRLAMVGEGADLLSVKPEDYAAFVEKYTAAAITNSTISLKDNLININRRQSGLPPFGGCAGYGCGAAFNFFSVLPDGEAHACRKLPSYIGNAFEQSIDEIYNGEAARQYRAGTTACASCEIRPVCGGCLAVTHGFGLDIFQKRDPYCWLQID